MTFLDKQTSVDDAQLVELVQINGGAAGTFFYTSAEDDVTIAAQLYTAVAGLKSGRVADGVSGRGEEYVLEMPTTDPLAQFFIRSVIPAALFEVTVMRYHRNDLPTPEVLTVFKGRIVSRSFNRIFKTTALTCRRELSRSGKQMPWRTYANKCPFVLYDPLTCTADDTSSTVKATALSVASQSGNVLTVSSGLAGVYADGWFTGGYVESLGASDFRTIISHEANELVMFAPFSVTPTSVTVLAGCDHLIAGDCDVKHDRVSFFGGFFAVPKKNVFRSGIGGFV